MIEAVIGIFSLLWKNLIRGRTSSARIPDMVRGQITLSKWLINLPKTLKPVTISVTIINIDKRLMAVVSRRF